MLEGYTTSTVEVTFFKDTTILIKSDICITHIGFILNIIVCTRKLAVTETYK
jgi:hypothetical protein